MVKVCVHDGVELTLPRLLDTDCDHDDQDGREDAQERCTGSAHEDELTDCSRA
jgi:hypothetical protein